MPEETAALPRTEVGWPLRVDEMVEGIELDVDAISDGTDWAVPGILEQADPPGVHSGDSLATLPPQHVPRAVQERAAEIAGRIALALGVRGILNVQMIAAGERIVVIEANPRASRTVPIVAKATGLDVVAAAVRCALGRRWRRWGWPPALRRTPRAWPSRRPSARCGASPGSAPSSVPRCARRARCSAWRPPPVRRPSWRSPRPPRTEAEDQRRRSMKKGRPGSSTEGPGTRRPPEDSRARSPRTSEAAKCRVWPELPSATGSARCSALIKMLSVSTPYTVSKSRADVASRYRAAGGTLSRRSGPGGGADSRHTSRR